VRGFRIVTVNAHQPYLHLFARLPVQMGIIQLPGPRHVLQQWSEAVRPLPRGWELLTPDQAAARIREGAYDLALAHNVSDYIDFNRFAIPKILVIHVSLTGRILEEKSGVDRKEYVADVARLVKMTGGRIVFISESKKRDWGLEGDVIPHGLDPEDYPPYTGEEPRILRVANHLRERDSLLDYRAHQALTRGFPLTLIGENPGIPGARRSRSWDDLKALYRSHRLYLHTAVEGCEDGYNLAMLEAMAAGMPVVTTAHPTSPIQDGVNGLVSSDLERLRVGIRELLDDLELAQRLGASARETVARDFSAETFAQRWTALFHEVVG